MELLTWKFYKEVLNFEEEADTKFSNIKLIMDKTRMIRRIDENSLFAYFNSRNALLVVSANPNTFQDIVLANKYLLMLSGYKEHDLENRKLSFILPRGVDEVHDRLLLKLLHDSKSLNGIIENNNLFLKNKNNTI